METYQLPEDVLAIYNEIKEFSAISVESVKIDAYVDYARDRTTRFRYWSITLFMHPDWANAIVKVIKGYPGTDPAYVANVANAVPQKISFRIRDATNDEIRRVFIW